MQVDWWTVVSLEPHIVYLEREVVGCLLAFPVLRLNARFRISLGALLLFDLNKLCSCRFLLLCLFFWVRVSAADDGDGADGGGVSQT